MEINLNEQKNKIFILGAGASVDYGLPIWKDLTILIKEYLLKPENLDSKYRKEILEWVDSIGDGKRYSTLDECIANETSSSKYKENGQDIEFAIFKTLKIIFDKLYNNEYFWIKDLNEKIRKQEGVDWFEIFFINYNYDKVLAKNILNFNYLPKTNRERIYRERIEELEGIIYRQDHRKIPCLYPHGLFQFTPTGFLNEMTDTINSHDSSLLQSVSCHHGKEHRILFDKNTSEVNIYILGLAGGLKINLPKLIFDDISRIKNIYITIKHDNNKSKIENEKNKKDTTDILTNNFGVPEENIFIYDNCIELIENCF